MQLPDDEWRCSLVSPAWAMLLATVFVALLGISASLSLAIGAETRRIGVISLDAAESAAPFHAAFETGLAEGGFREGQNIVIERRFAALNPNVLPSLAAELVASRVDLLVADGTQAALAAKAATRSIPIVVSISADLVRPGLVVSLARPGGNVTGMVMMSPGLVGKRLALLKEMAPRIRRVAVVANPDNPASVFQLQEAQEAAPGLGLKLHSLFIQRAQDIDRVGSSLREHADAMLITDDFVLDAVRPQIGSLAFRNRMPWICNYALSEDKVCLMWYGPDIMDIYTRAGRLAARVLNGNKPSDLPVEQPTKFVLGINARTAAALELPVPQSLMLAADEVVR